MQWRSQGHSFGGGGKMRAPKARVILGGSGGMLSRKILNLEYRKCIFLHFPVEILQKKILLLIITHTPPPSISPRISSFRRGGPSTHWRGWAPPCPPLSTPLHSCKHRQSNKILYLIVYDANNVWYNILVRNEDATVNSSPFRIF